MTSINIRTLALHEPLPMHLLLLADPIEEFVFAYIHNSQIFVAEQEKEAVGVLVLQQRGDAAELMNVGVAEKAQGQGIGRQLVEHAMEQARQKSIKQLIVCTGNSSLPALALYKSCGFSVESIDKDYFLHNYPEPIIENGLPCTDRIKLRLEL